MIKLTAELPREIEISGAAYAINTDFRIMADFEVKISGADPSDNKAFLQILSETVAALFIEIPDAPASEIISGLLWYYRCGREPETSVNSGSGGKRYYDYDEDSDYIYAAFLQQYGDDLLTAKMHWWEFRAKFMGLTDSTEFVKIMQYRGTDLSKIKNKNEKARLKKLQERYALKNKNIHKYSTLEERDKAFKDKVSRRYEEVRKLAGKE